jgi:hypothetical protein
VGLIAGARRTAACRPLAFLGRVEHICANSPDDAEAHGMAGLPPYVYRADGEQPYASPSRTHALRSASQNG